jgi:hypothetical protein
MAAKSSVGYTYFLSCMVTSSIANVSSFTIRRKKIILVWICLTSVSLFFVGLLLLFYITPIHDCEICKYFNCIPITKDFCADQDIDLHSDI